MPEPYQTIVVGGGISGLSLAHHALRRGNRTLLLEQEQRLGGCLHSHRFDQCDDFWTELGAHTCYNSYGGLLAILEQLGQLQRIEAKQKLSFKVEAGDDLKSVFSRLRLGELLFSLPRMRRETKQGKTVAQYYRRIAGARNYEQLLSHAFAAVISQNADEIPADFLFHRRSRRKDVTKNFTFPEGLSEIATGIAGQPGFMATTGAAVASIQRTPEGFRVQTKSGEQYDAKDLILATPAAVTARLLAQPFPEIAEPLERIRSVRIESISVAAPQGAADVPLLAGIIGTGGDFYSAVSRDVRPDDRYRGFTFHFRPGILDREAKLAKICSVLRLERSQIRAVAERENLLPAPVLGHERHALDIDERLRGKRLGLVGNYFSGVSIEDCVQRSRDEFARLYPNG